MASYELDNGSAMEETETTAVPTVVDVRIR